MSNDQKARAARKAKRARKQRKMNSNQNQGTKKKQQPRRRIPKVGKLSKLAVSIMNPEKAPGTRWPDLGTQPTVTYQTRWYLEVTTGTAGTYAVVVHPSLYLGTYIDNTFATLSSANSFVGGNWPAYTAVTATYNASRCVGLSLSFNCTQNALNAQGELIISQVPQSTPAVILPSSMAQQLNSDIMHERLPLARTIGNDVYVYAKPLDIVAKEFKSIGSFSGEGWNSIVFAVIGTAASTRVGTIEVVANWELLVKPEGLAIGAEMPAREDPSYVQRALDAVYDMPNITCGTVALGTYLAGQYVYDRVMRR